MFGSACDSTSQTIDVEAKLEKHIHTHNTARGQAHDTDARALDSITSMTFGIAFFLVGVGQRAVCGQWVTGGYAASQVNAYISGSGTTMFNGVSSSAPSYSAPAPAPATCDARGVSRCEDVSLYDSDGQYCELEGSRCVDLAVETCASGAVEVRGTSISVDAALPGISDDLFDGYYVERSTRLGDHAIYASTASSPSLVLYHCDDAAKFGAEGAWLAHAFFGDVADDAALAAEIAACPHLVQWQSGARLAGASRAQNAVATSTTADVTTRTSTVVVTCFAPGPCGAGTAVLSGARVATADADYGLWDGAYETFDGVAAVNFLPVRKREGAIYAWYAYYCARAATWLVTTLEGLDAARGGSCDGYVSFGETTVAVAADGAFAAAPEASLACATAEGCAGGVDLSGTALAWGGSEGSLLPSDYLDGAYVDGGASSGGLPVYESSAVEGLAVLFCGAKWHVAFAASGCDDGIVLGYVASPALSKGSIFANRDVDTCADGVYPCVYDAVVGASATCHRVAEEEEDAPAEEEDQSEEEEGNIEEADAAARAGSGVAAAAVALLSWAML